MEDAKQNRRGLDKEFETVELLLTSQLETRAADAFCLTWIKLERQLRKLVANVLYQASSFSEHDEVAKTMLRAALLTRVNIKHDHFVGGIRRLTGCSLKQLLGDRYAPLRRAVDNGYVIRNKLFHGQQSGLNLDRDALIAIQRDIYEWCAILATEAYLRFGYDGFGRNSLQKTHRVEIVALVDDAIRDIGWEEFIRKL
jgi:hypothetical protein